MRKNIILKGVTASPGFALGKAVIINENLSDYKNIKYSGKDAELERLDRAVDAYKEELKKTDCLKILDGQLSILSDELMCEKMKTLIKNGDSAERAVDTVCSENAEKFRSSKSEIIKQRGDDIDDIKRNLIQLLTGKKPFDFSKLEDGSVLVMSDIAPSQACRIDGVKAVICERGAVLSHSAIILRSRGIPAVFSVHGCTEAIKGGDAVFADGSGKVYINPSDEIAIDTYNAEQTCVIPETNIKVLGNIETSAQAKEIIACGGDGIGLFRTEFIFMNGIPDEEEQFEIYKSAAKIMGEKDVIIRVLDAGGDKKIPLLNPTESRGTRLLLNNEDIFKTQVRALLRAAAYGNVKIQLPFVTTLEEVKAAKRIINTCANELKKEGKAHKKAPIGTMIETPAAVLILDLLAKEADFFSIGTNDLTATVMAADRYSERNNHIFTSLSPSVLRAVELTVKNAKESGIKVCVCGELATNKKAIPELIKAGIDSLSVPVNEIMRVKDLLKC